jgi:hypothetical protein
VLKLKPPEAGTATPEICDLAARWLSALEGIDGRPVPVDVLFEVLRMEASEWRAGNAGETACYSADEPVLLGNDHSLGPV